MLSSSLFAKIDNKTLFIFLRLSISCLPNAVQLAYSRTCKNSIQSLVCIASAAAEQVICFHSPIVCYLFIVFPHNHTHTHTQHIWQRCVRKRHSQMCCYYKLKLVLLLSLFSVVFLWVWLCDDLCEYRNCAVALLWSNDPVCGISRNVLLASVTSIPNLIDHKNRTKSVFSRRKLEKWTFLRGDFLSRINIVSGSWTSAIFEFVAFLIVCPPNIANQRDFLWPRTKSPTHRRSQEWNSQLSAKRNCAKNRFNAKRLIFGVNVNL